MLYQFGIFHLPPPIWKLEGIIIVPVVLRGSEAWSLIVREEHRLGVSENKVLSRIFGLQKENECNRKLEKLT
jgi:hypothetical protein